MKRAAGFRIPPVLRFMMVLVAALPGASLAAAQAGVEACSPKYYVMRHLDRVSGVDSLNAKGLKRAQQLARWFHDRPLAAILSLGLARTMQTAGPTAEARGVTLKTFGSTRELIAALKIAPTPALAVVHGDSVPLVVAAMTKRPAGEGFGFGRVWIIDCGHRVRIATPFEERVVGMQTKSKRTS